MTDTSDGPSPQNPAPLAGRTMPTPVERLCWLPRDFRVGDKSPLQLVDDSGIRRDPAQLTVNTVLEALRREPELVTHWLEYSADKRTTGGWYFVENSDSRFVVGTIAGQRIDFDDAALACANFIVRELSGILGRADAG